jgi:hypothetical protein
MAQVDGLYITNFVNTGQTTPMARYTFVLRVEWTDDDGVKHTHGPQTYTFPNDLAAMPLAVRRKFAEEMIYATARVALGFNTWEDYA